MTAPASNKPRISVIIPIYNVAAHVAACINSMRIQTLTDFEVLMIDDGSTDGSGDIAVQAAGDDPRFRLITQENAGLSDARNTGLNTATGTFIAFVDSDDRVMPDYLMRLWQTLEDTGGDWVACAIQSSYPDGTGSHHSAIHGAAEMALHGAAQRYPFESWSDVIRHFPSAWNKLYRRTLIEGLRFDKGTWFEDHGFFHQAAARTDHIIHLPELLYIQTRGRDGQITSQDSERVFEQFIVLADMQKTFEASTRPGGKAAMARIASRLVFERSTIISNPDRRARFAAAARDFLAQNNLTYTTDWDTEIGLSWEMEMAGAVPLSVILSWDGTDIVDLRRSLDSLRTQTAPGHEVLIVCQTNSAERALTESGIPILPHWQIVTARQKGSAAGFNHGMSLASGAFVVFLDTGDALTPWTLLNRVDAMLRDSADFGITQLRLQDRDTGKISYHNGMHDMDHWPAGPPPSGPLILSPAQSLGLEAHCSAKIFLRTFLLDSGLAFTHGPRADWTLCLTAALLAPCTIYIASEGATIALRDQGFERWHAPLSATALNKGHVALLETVNRVLPEEKLTNLPKGWQRKLFARALREQVYFGDYKGRRSKLLMVTGAAWTALRKGYGARTQAGLDPFIGPRLAKTLDPVRFVLNRLGLAGNAATTISAPIVDPGLPQVMHAFDLQDHGLLQMRAHFHTARYANVHFRASARGPARFHLSLRHDEGLAVCNHQLANGQWQTEQLQKVDLSAGHADVTITFTPPQVCVALNGVEIFRFGTEGLRRKPFFPGFERIAGFTLEGDITTPHVMPLIPETPLILDSRLNLRLATHDDNARLHVQPSDIELTLIRAPLDTATAILPARLWHDLPRDSALTVALTQGAKSHQLTISREDVLSRIEALLTLPVSHGDSTVCLTILEHVRHGGLREMLTPPARQYLDVIAKFYGVQDFVLTGFGNGAQDDTLPATARQVDHDPIGSEIESAVARIAQSQSVAEDKRADPLAVVAGMQVSAQATPNFFLALTEYFCSEGRNFMGLHRLAKDRDLLPFDPPTNRWGLSAVLPYLLAERQYSDISDSLRAVAKPDADWLVLSAIAWTVREAIVRPDTPAKARGEIYYAYADLLHQRADDYWDRVHCRELTRTAASLIRHRHRLEPHLQRDATTLCLNIYGLSGQFWADLADAPDLPADIMRAQRAFAQVMSADVDRDIRDRALLMFENAKNVDAPRVRREIFGPAGLSDPKLRRIDTPDLAGTQTLDGHTLGRNILRHMANPGALPVTPAVADLASKALPELYDDTPRAPYFDTQRSAGKQAMALLSKPQAQADITALTDSLTQLSDAGSHYLGLGIALSLIDGLHDSDPARALMLCEWLLAQIARLDPASYRSSPALQQPARRLHQRTTLLPAVVDILDHLNLQTITAQSTDNNGLPDGSPLFDTIIIVFSCAAYLDTRIPALRKGWLGMLEDLGVPYVVVVGDGDGTRQGDIVHLDAPDDYEGLPQKTLAAIKWVHDNTRFGHMLKIDDDCFLNAPLFFESLSYRKFDYYGRRLHRVAGQMDRKWHQEKSRSPRGRLDLDKSPEPSEYADGGSAYALSRTAMAAVIDAAASPEGLQLISVSFMEDKMTGDLLALRGIRAANEDYRISVRRRTFSEALPVASWLNSFHASQTASLQLVHLDTHLDQADAVKRLSKPGLWPRKIWPSYQDVKLGYQSNALELISSEESVERARQADVAVVACMRNEIFMVPNFLAHYRKLGITAFLIADNCSDDGTLEYLADQPDVALFSVDTDYKMSRYGVAWQQAMMAAFRVDKWSLIADADELLVWQKNQTQTLPDLLKTDDFRASDAVRVFMLDMYPNGPLENADFASGTPFDQSGFVDRIPFLTSTLSRGPYANQPCWTSALRHRLIPRSHQNLFVAQKLALLRYRPTMRLSAGMHFVGDVTISPRELLFAHFKYNADFRRKVQTEVNRGQHFNDAEEYRKYLALSSEGRSVIYDANLSAPWTDVSFVKSRLSD